MMKKYLFKEKTRYRDTVGYVILGLGIGVAGYGLMDALLAPSPNYLHAVFFASIGLLLALRWWWLRRLRLKVSVTPRRIKYRLHPVQDKPQKIPWEEVESCRIVKTPPAARWHGSNLHFGREAWYSLTGRNGLALRTRDGHRYFIGCRNIDKLKQALKKLHTPNDQPVPPDRSSLASTWAR